MSAGECVPVMRAECAASAVTHVWRRPIDRAGHREEVILELRNGRMVTVSGVLTVDAARSMRASLWLEVSR